MGSERLDHAGGTQGHDCSHHRRRNSRATAARSENALACTCGTLTLEMATRWLRYTMYYGDFPGVEIVSSDFRKVDGLILAVSKSIFSNSHRMMRNRMRKLRKQSMDVTKVSTSITREHSRYHFTSTWHGERLQSPTRKSVKSFILRTAPQTLAYLPNRHTGTFRADHRVANSATAAATSGDGPKCAVTIHSLSE